MDSILQTMRKMVLGMPINSESPDEPTAFDTDLIININSAFSVLTQLGAGPAGGFFISDYTAKWSDFIDSEREDLEMIKMFVYCKTKLGFDPPSNSSAAAQMEKNMKEYEWRICEAYANH